MHTFRSVQRKVSGPMALFFFLSTLLSACGGTPTAPVSDQQELDPAIVANNQLAERMENWISLMDPFVTQNEDWTFTLDWEAFLASVQESDPIVVAYFHGSSEGNDDTTAIESLRDGIPIANVEMLTQYEAYQNLPEGAHMAKWKYSYWWGRVYCYSGSDADYVILLLTLGMISAAIPQLGVLSAALITVLLGYATYCDSVHGQFCLNVPWTVINTWVSCW